MARLRLELVTTGHLSAYWWCVRGVPFNYHVGPGRLAKHPSPYSSHVLSHAVAYLYYFKLTTVSQGSIKKACPRGGKEQPEPAWSFFFKASKNTLPGQEPWEDTLLRMRTWMREIRTRTPSHFLTDSCPFHTHQLCSAGSVLPLSPTFFHKSSNLSKRFPALIAQHPLLRVMVISKDVVKFSRQYECDVT